MELQHVNVKMIVDGSAPVDLGPAIPVFHSWIQDRACEELLLDVADYRHVPAGPGVVLIGHEANYSLDNTDHRLGVRYNRKEPLGGTAEDRLTQAVRAALLACQRLESDPRLEGKLRFGGREWEFFVNDRLLAPNEDSSRQALDPEFQIFLRKLFSEKPYTLQYNLDDPRRLFSVRVETSDSFTPDQLLKNLLS
ncbi:MAG TPA: hypothetical protein VNJ12_14020 [Candidatus Dormibacteraeota bacterium]|nr:hypothetical protein [Candidatus Dormibacteraeota bacterium]